MDELRERAERWLRERYKDNPRYVVDPSDVNLLADFATEVVKSRDAEIERLRRQVEAGRGLAEMGRWAAGEWRLHGSLTDSCRKLEAALAAWDSAAKI